MPQFVARNLKSKTRVDVLDEYGSVIYTSDPHVSPKDAMRESRRWYRWFQGVSSGAADTIYYILAVPIAWPGPPIGGHRYSGLHFKIGYARSVLKRLQNLRTGTSEDLIIHALEPGDRATERARHLQFASDRRQGEWFAASRVLCKHVLQTWRKCRVLPPEHQARILQFADRSDIYAKLRVSSEFDMVNPSINDPWHGRVFLDLVNTPLARRKPGEAD